MKSQLNTLAQLQELILTRDEHHQTGDGSHLDQLNDSIDALAEKLDPQLKGLYRLLYKRDHIVSATVTNGCCAACGMRLPVSQLQQVRFARTIQTCSNCGRVLINEEEDAPRNVTEKPDRHAPRKTGISRFSAEELMIADLKSSTPVDAINELATVMEQNRFVSNAGTLTAMAAERESVLSTAMGDDVAFPHVRGVEGGGLVLALGISKDGIKWDDDGNLVHIVCFSVIPVAVSAFYLRLMSSLTEAFSGKAAKKSLIACADSESLWKVLNKVTRTTVK